MLDSMRTSKTAETFQRRGLSASGTVFEDVESLMRLAKKWLDSPMSPPCPGYEFHFLYALRAKPAADLDLYLNVCKLWCQRNVPPTASAVPP